MSSKNPNDPNQQTASSSKSPGNPNASDVMAKVNRPKIDNAINFALIFKPVITNFELKNLAQRKMVEMLNDKAKGDNFTPPEGGKWVLSQLQKIMNRIKLNDAALNLENKFIQYDNQNLSNQQIADKLNNLGECCPIEAKWNPETIEKVKERICQIHDIIHFNDIIIKMLPIIQQEKDKLDAEAFYQLAKNSLNESDLKILQEIMKAAAPATPSNNKELSLLLQKLIKLRLKGQQSAREALTRLEEYEQLQTTLKQNGRLKPVHEKIYQQHIILAEHSYLILKEKKENEAKNKTKLG